MPSPKRLSSSAKKRAANKDDEGDATYDDDRGASGLARDFKKGLEGQVAKKLGVKKPQATEIKSFLNEEFDDFSSIDREEFLLKTKRWKAFEKLGIGKPELKRIYHSVDRKAGGFGSINYRDILQYIALGDKRLSQELNDDDDEDDVDKGVWGASPIVDIQLSTSDLEEARLQKDGYEKVLSSGDLPANLNDGSLMASPILLWYRRRSQGGSGVRLKPIVDVILSDKLVDSALVIAGYTCLNKSTNKGTITGKAQYLWVRRAFNTEEEEKDAIVDVAVTKGNKKDMDNHIYKPPGRGFIQVVGDINHGYMSAFSSNIFLWFRPITPRSAEKDWRYGVPDDERNYELECRARRAIRQFVSPADLNFSPRGGPTDFAVLFNRHATSKSAYDPSRVGTVNVSQFGTLLKEVGLNINAKDIRHLMHRIDSAGSGRMSREEFLSFVQLNDDQLDEVAMKIRDFFGATKGASDKKVLKAIRQRFKRLDGDGDGILDIDEFRQMVQMVGIFLTEPELMRLRKVFDPNGDGMIGKEEFEDVILRMDDTVKRQCVRVCEAANGLRDYILQCQRDIRKKGSKDGIDSQSAWLDLERKHKRGVGGAPFPNYLDLEDVAQAVERLGFRLSQPETRMLIMRVAPDGDGRVSEVEFHEFATEPKPRPIGELINICGKDKDALMAEAMNPKLKNTKLRRYMNRIVTAIGPDDIGLVTFEVLANGLSTFFNYRERAGQPTDGELVAVAQYLGAVDVRFFMVDPRLFIIGLRAECCDEDPAELMKLFEDDEDGTVYSDLLKEKKRNRSKSYSNSDDEDTEDSDEEYEYVEVEVEEEQEVEDKVLDVCEELAAYFQEVSEVDGEKGTFDYEKALDAVHEGREPGSLMDIENQFSTWLNELGEVEALTDEQFGQILERFDPKTTNSVGAKQIEAFCNNETWDAERKIETVTRIEKKKVKKPKKTTKNVSSPRKTPKNSSKKNKRRNYNSDDSDDTEYDDESDYDDDGEENDSEPEDSPEEVSDDDDSDDFYGGRGRRSRRSNSEEEDDEEDFSISSPIRKSSKRKITGSADSDVLVIDIAKTLSTAHRGVPLEQMVKSELRKMDVFGNGMLRAEEIGLVLKSLGYKRKITVSTPGLNFFLDRGGHVDFNGFAQAIGQAQWELEHGTGGDRGRTGSKKLDKKLRTLGVDLKEASKKVDRIFGKLVRDDGTLRKGDLKKGLAKLSAETHTSLSEAEIGSFFSALNEETGGNGGKTRISLSNWRQFVKSGGSMLQVSNEEPSAFADHSFYSKDGGIDIMDSDVQSAVDRCIEELDDLDLSEKQRNKIPSWFDKVDKNGKGVVKVAKFEAFLKKSKIGARLSNREKKCLIRGFDGGRDKVDYESFLDKVLNGRMGSEGGEVAAEMVLAKMQEAVGVSARGGMTYSTIFSRYDPSGSGLVSKEGLISAFRSAGCFLTDSDLRSISTRLKRRSDDLLDYNDLYHTLLQTTPRIGAGTYVGATPFSAITRGGGTTPWGGQGPGQLGMSMQVNSPYGGSGGNPLGQTWPPPGGMAGTPWQTQTPFNPNMTLGGSAAMGGGGSGGDYLLQDVAMKLRNAMRQRVSQWGPSVSLHRQFEASDPDRRGYIPLKAFLMVLEQLGLQLVPVEAQIICRRFDRHGNDTIDYLDFCRFVSIDAREMEIVANKLAGKFSELRRRGVSATATFDVYDIGRSGFISRRDFRECSRQLQLPITENQLEALMGRFAHQGDSELVSWQEFITFVNASGVNLPNDIDERPVMGDGYDGMDVWKYEGDAKVGHADRAGGSPKREGRAGEDDYRDMYRSLRAHNRDEDVDKGFSGADFGRNTGLLIDHTSKSRTHTQDMERSREVGREAVNYLDNHGVTTPKWIRSVLKVGRGKEGFDNDDDGDDGIEFGNKRISRSPLRSKKKKKKSSSKRSGRKARYRGGASDSDSDW